MARGRGAGTLRPTAGQGPGDWTRAQTTAWVPLTHPVPLHESGPSKLPMFGSVPCASLSSSGDIVGGITTATVGNAAEVIVSCIALKSGRVDLVQVGAS